jgi:hypothetical protein
MAATIPIIDLGSYLAGEPDARERAAAQVGRALEINRRNIDLSVTR